MINVPVCMNFDGNQGKNCNCFEAIMKLLFINKLYDKIYM